MKSITQKKADADLPVLLDDASTVYEVAKHLKQGKSIEQVAEKMNLSKNHIRNLIRAAMQELLLDNQHAITAWLALSISRTEDIIGGVYPHMFDGDGVPNETNINLILRTIKTQKEILEVFRPKSEAPNNEYEDTVSRSSKLSEDERYWDFKHGKQDELDGIVAGGVTYGPSSFREIQEEADD